MVGDLGGMVNSINDQDRITSGRRLLDLISDPLCPVFDFTGKVGRKTAVYNEYRTIFPALELGENIFFNLGIKNSEVNKEIHSKGKISAKISVGIHSHILNF